MATEFSGTGTCITCGTMAFCLNCNHPLAHDLSTLRRERDEARQAQQVAESRLAEVEARLASDDLIHRSFHEEECDEWAAYSASIWWSWFAFAWEAIGVAVERDGYREMARYVCEKETLGANVRNFLMYTKALEKLDAVVAERDSERARAEALQEQADALRITAREYEEGLRLRMADADRLMLALDGMRGERDAEREISIAWEKKWEAVEVTCAAMREALLRLRRTETRRESMTLYENALRPAESNALIDAALAPDAGRAMVAELATLRERVRTLEALLPKLKPKHMCGWNGMGYCGAVGGKGGYVCEGHKVQKEYDAALSPAPSSPRRRAPRGRRGWDVTCTAPGAG